MEAFFDDLKDKFFKDDRLLEMAQIASENSWKYEKGDRFSTQPTELKEFGIFRGKNNKRLRGILSLNLIDLNLRLRIYDYFYYGDGGKRKTTIFELFSNSLNITPFDIHPKGGLKKLTSIFGSKNTIFPDQKEFHAEYEIESQDNEATEFELSPGILEIVKEQKGLSMEGGGRYVLIYRKNKQIPAADIPRYYDLVVDMADHLINDHSNEYV